MRVSDIMIGMTDKKRILLAEDEAPMAKALSIKLEREGYGVDVARTGKEAIEFLEKSTYDLILLDLVMPIVDGFGVLAWMTSNDVKTPVVVLSNLSQSEDVKKTQAYGVKGFFIKADTPITDLIKEVKTFI